MTQREPRQGAAGWPRGGIKFAGPLCYRWSWTLALQYKRREDRCVIFNFAFDTAEQGAQPVDDETAKALVMAQITRIIDEGRAATTRLESGVLELRFTTGEVFHLGDEGITRIA